MTITDDLFFILCHCTLHNELYETMLISKGPGMSRDVPGLFSSKQSRHIDQTIPNYQNELKHY